MSDISSVVAVCGDCYVFAGGYDPEDRNPMLPRPCSHLISPMGAPNTPRMDTVDDTEHFSKYPCEGCGDTFHGSRYDIRVYWNTPEE